MTSSRQTSNPHLSDPSLRSIISPTFSPIDFLNATLPSVTTSKQQQQSASSLSSVASRTQSHISALNAQCSRLSSALTTITDEILRASSRLAYEVELLRGEALSLADALSSRGDLNHAITKFVPAGLDSSAHLAEDPLLPLPNKDSPQGRNPQKTIDTHHNVRDATTGISMTEPEALPRLRMLLHVRAQLQTVIQRFNLALSFPLPPSLLTTTASSLISINPPNQDPDLESKGQAALSRIRHEVLDLLADDEGRGAGLERAKERIADLRELCTIWKGTEEDKARRKWVDGLEQMVDEETKKEGGKGRGTVIKSEAGRDTTIPKSTLEPGGNAPGFLKRLRDEIYME